MEIADYLKVARRRWWILVLVPLLAAGAALAYGLLTPKTYSSTATVLTPSLVGTQYSQFTGPQAISQFVSAFAASAADPTVVAQTAKDTGVSTTNLTDQVSVAQVGASSNVKLTYSGPDENGAQAVAQTLAKNALTNIYSAQGKIAGMQVSAAKKALDAANKAVNAYVVKVGVGEPAAAYQAAINQVTWLQQTQATYRASGDNSAADLMSGPIAAAQKQARAIGTVLPQYNTLLSAQTVANATYQSVLGDQRKVQVQATAAADPGVIQTSAAEPDVTAASIAKLVIPVFGAAVLLAIILIALFEFIAAVRRQPSGVTGPAGARSAGSRDGSADLASGSPEPEEAPVESEATPGETPFPEEEHPPKRVPSMIDA